ncbi:MAG: hypothetical protein M1401_11125 [Chloroflexi bacterium]|nr:hypothetical protein [Chloroflexota bacterium]
MASHTTRPLFARLARSRVPTVLAVFLAVVLALSGITSALAVSGLGLFELDGNAFTDGNTIATPDAAPAGPPDDWDRIYAPLTYGANSAKATEFLADGVGAGDDIFTGGGSKDNHVIADWL